MICSICGNSVGEFNSIFDSSLEGTPIVIKVQVGNIFVSGQTYDYICEECALKAMEKVVKEQNQMEPLDKDIAFHYLTVIHREMRLLYQHNFLSSEAQKAFDYLGTYILQKDEIERLMKERNWER